MNVILYNENKELSNLNVEIIKNINGEFAVNELINMFTNFLFNKMFLDITCIRDYNNYVVLKQLFSCIDPNKVIILLNENTNNSEYLSNLITLGVYNFTNNLNEVIDLFNNPRTYNDVSHLQITKSNYDINNEIDEKLGINKKDDFTFKDFVLPNEYEGNKKIIGVVNLTSHAGATTLIVQMIKQLNLYYKAIAIEMNKQDFIHFDTKGLFSCMSNIDVLKVLKENQDVDAVLVDLNEVDYKEFCTDVIYLIEPGVIKLNKLISKNKNVFRDLDGEKIVLNRTNMDDKLVSEFEVEGNLKVFSVVSNFRDNLDRVISVDKLLDRLGYIKCLKGDKKNKFSLFKKGK